LARVHDRARLLAGPRLAARLRLGLALRLGDGAPLLALLPPPHPLLRERLLGIERLGGLLAKLGELGLDRGALGLGLLRLVRDRLALGPEAELLHPPEQRLLVEL